MDIKGFVTPEQNLEALNKVSDTLAAQKIAKKKLDEEAKKTKAASALYLSSYLNPKDYLTGTVNDPYITKRVYQILDNAQAMNDAGQDLSTIRMTVNGDVSNLNQASEGIKEIKRQEDAAVAKLSSRKGIDTQKLKEGIEKHAYYNPDGTLKSDQDINAIDPSFNYVDHVLNNEDIYTSGGIENYAATAKQSSTSDEVTKRDRSGRLYSVSRTISKPDYMDVKKDANGNILSTEPRHDYYTDEGIVQMHDFIGDGKSKEPIKLLDDNAYDALMKDSNADAAPFIKMQVKKYTDKYNIPLNSPQAEAFSKAIAFNYLNQSSKDKVNITEKSKDMYPTPQRQTTFNFNYGDGGVEGKGYTGNVLDEVSFSDKKLSQSGQQVNVADGTAKDDKGKPFTGTVDADPSEVPEKLRGVIYDNASGYNFWGSKGKAEIRFKDGQIQGIRYKKADGSQKSTEVKRTDFEDWLQIKAKKSSEKSGKDPAYAPTNFGKKTSKANPSDKGWANDL